MIVVTLMGVLGNQMFQYAFGRGLATRLQRRLVLDLSMLPSGAPPFQRTYGLRDLSIDKSVWRFAEHRFGTLREEPRPRIQALGTTLRSRMSRFIVREPSSEHRLPDTAIPSSFAICVGYWQSESYFSDIASTIRRELEPSVPDESAVTRILRLSDTKTRILVHIRRGDYAESERVQQVHGLQPVNYYGNAVQLILGAISDDAQALVLSDDPEWARENLKLPIETQHVEVGSRLTAAEGLGLMRRCEHHVISNSSFSWWGAWLGQHSEQIVVYPRQWFKTRDVVTSFRFPAQWVAR